MFCTNCGKQINDDATYCVWCGMPVESVEPVESFAPVRPAVSGPAPSGNSRRTLIIVIAAVVGAMVIAAILIWAFLGRYSNEGTEPGAVAGSEEYYGDGATDVIGGDGDIESTENIYQGDYLPESSDRYLSAGDVEGFSRNDLNYPINELYARHGATFTDDDVIAYFNGKDWYSPRQSKEAARSEFTEIEEKNFMFLCDYRDSKYPN